MTLDELSIQMDIHFAWWSKPFVISVVVFCLPLLLFKKTIPDCVINWASDVVVKYGATLRLK